MRNKLFLCWREQKHPAMDRVMKAFRSRRYGAPTGGEEALMLGVFRKIRRARKAKRGLTEAFRIRGHDFMTLNPAIHDAMIKEAMARGVDATMKHFDYVETDCSTPWGGGLDQIVYHYTRRSKRFE